MKRIHKSDIPDLTRKINLSMQAKKPVDNKHKFVYLVGKTTLLMVFVGLAIYGVFYAWSWSVATGKVPSETFTELYFEDNLHLPSEVIPKQLYFFQFTLHNLEGKDMEYPYVVYVKLGQDKLIFDKGTIFVKENGYKTVLERFATASVLPKSKIVVDLIHKNQIVDFWIQGRIPYKGEKR